MGDKNHLHVCRDCGNVMATSSFTGPRHCSDCGDTNFSVFLVLPETMVEPVDGTTLVWRLYGEFAEVSGSKEATVTVGAQDGHGPTVREAVHALVAAFPPLKERVVTDENELRGNAVVVHNHRNVYTEPTQLDTELTERDTLGLFPRIK